jgi:hypothetical protein
MKFRFTFKTFLTIKRYYDNIEISLEDLEVYCIGAGENDETLKEAAAVWFQENWSELDWVDEEYVSDGDCEVDLLQEVDHHWVIKPSGEPWWIKPIPYKCMGENCRRFDTTVVERGDLRAPYTDEPRCEQCYQELLAEQVSNDHIAAEYNGYLSQMRAKAQLIASGGVPLAWTEQRAEEKEMWELFLILGGLYPTETLQKIREWLVSADKKAEALLLVGWRQL